MACIFGIEWIQFRLLGEIIYHHTVIVVNLTIFNSVITSVGKVTLEM